MLDEYTQSTLVKYKLCPSRDSRKHLPDTHENILITVQRDATQSSLFIILQVHSTCFGCPLHPSSGVHKTLTTASGTGHFFVQLRWREVAAQKI